MQYEFDGVISRLEGKIKWNVVYFPYAAEDAFGSHGNIPVIITVDGYEFEHTLLPSRNGHYFVYNEFIKRVADKQIGDSVHVTLIKDERDRVYKAPEYILKALQDNGVSEKFHDQPDYYKREQVNFIEAAKRDETKTNRLKKLVERFL